MQCWFQLESLSFGIPRPRVSNSKGWEAQTVFIHLTGSFSRPPLEPRAAADKHPFSLRTAPLWRPRSSVRPHGLRSWTLGNDSPRLRKLPGPRVASSSGFSFPFFLQLWTLGTFLTFLQAELGVKRTLSVLYLTREMVIAHRRHSGPKINIARTRNRFFESCRLFPKGNSRKGFLLFWGPSMPGGPAWWVVLDASEPQRETGPRDRGLALTPSKQGGFLLQLRGSGICRDNGSVPQVLACPRPLRNVIRITELFRNSCWLIDDSANSAIESSLCALSSSENHTRAGHRAEQHGHPAPRPAQKRPKDAWLDFWRCSHSVHNASATNNKAEMIQVLLVQLKTCFWKTLRRVHSPRFTLSTTFEGIVGDRELRSLTGRRKKSLSR